MSALRRHIWLTAFCISISINPAEASEQHKNPAEISAKICPKGKRADDYKSWEFIANNARRIADEYATDHNPRATFIIAKIDPVFQQSGEYAGSYLVKMVNESGKNISFAVLWPNFPFCADPSKLDDSRSDLFKVVIAKFNGRIF